MNELLDFLTFSSTHSLIEICEGSKKALAKVTKVVESRQLSPSDARVEEFGEKRAKEVRRLGPILR